MYRYDFDSRTVFSEGCGAGWFIAHLPVHTLKLIIQSLIIYCYFIILGLNGRFAGIVLLTIAMRTGIIIVYIIAENIYIPKFFFDIFVK